MSRTLLIGHPRVSWRDWLRQNQKGEAFLCLDPADAVQGTPGVLNLFVNSKPLKSRFYGTLDPQRQPSITLSFLSEALESVDGHLIIQTFAHRATPVLRQTLMLVAQLARPDRILIAQGTEIDRNGFPVGPEEVELEPALPPMVQHAQRKAQWLRLLESCERQTVDLRGIAIEGARLGSGRAMTDQERKAAALNDAVYAEVCGTTLFTVTDAELEEEAVSKALDYTGCSKAIFVEPNAYRNLFCSFARQGGEDFAYGILTHIEWNSMRAEILSTAVPPAPVRLLRLGTIRVDTEGRELGEIRPWQV